LIRTANGLPVVIIITILTLSALYAPQPLLPLLASEFQISRDMAALLTTIAFLPLCIAPLLYGRILSAFTPRQLLRGAIPVLALAEFLFPLCSTIWGLFAVRLLQGLMIPAILTAMMTYLSTQSAPSEIRRTMGIYIASTIIGGLLGRTMSGSIATLIGWHYSFYILGISLLFGFLLLSFLDPGQPPQGAGPRGAIFTILREKNARRTYITIFCMFFVFAAVMNYLPFRVEELDASASEMRIGFMYSGYLLGIVTALNAGRFNHFLGSTSRTMMFGLAGLILALVGMLTPGTTPLFLFMFPFCGAMFLVHSTASGNLNSLGLENKGMVNGLYVAFYYGGGMLGSSLPGPIYQQFGWPAFIALLIILTSGGIVAASGIDPQQKQTV
jgi:YNFM family putative membrane transporter